MRSTVLLLSIFTIHHGVDWTPVFDGTTLEGWQASENPTSWSVKDGALHGDGSASRLFYREMKCLNCEFKADVRISRGGNSGIDVRARSGPGAQQGYENRITAPDPSMPEDAWVNHHVIIEGNHIQIFINDKKIVDYIDEKNTYTEGFLALRQSGVGTVDFKNVMMRALPAPSTPFSGTWKLNSEQSKLAPDAPVETEIRVLDERDGIRWQSAAGTQLGANFFGRPDGYDYRVTGSPVYDHVSLQEVDKHLVHLALREAKVRKKTDPRTFLAEMKEGRDAVARIVYTIAPDGKTMTVEGTWKHGSAEGTPFKEVFEKLD